MPDADPPLPNRPAQSFCRDPLIPYAPMMRPPVSELTEPVQSLDVRPSIPADFLEPVDNAWKKASDAIEKSDYQSRQVDACQAIIHQLMRRLNVTSVNLDGALTEMGPRATVKRGEVFYHVNAGTPKGRS